MVESQGKVSEKSGNFEMDIEWQPCINTTSILAVCFAFNIQHVEISILNFSLA